MPHPPEAPRFSPLHAEHERLGATFTDFGGWQMPLRYGSELAEHRAVREAAGLFDLSHMGEVRVTGPGAGAALDYALVGRLSAIAVGRAKYSLMCADDGGIIDDLIVYRLTDDEYLVVPNAGNTLTVAAELSQRARAYDATVVDESATTALLALQGPHAARILRRHLDADNGALVTSLKYYAATPATVVGIEALVARTGYTGEDGFELFVPHEHAVALWTAMEESWEESGIVPCGLAARDSLRLEAGMPLYGNELTRHVSPFEAGLGGVVALAKDGDFVGRTALQQQKNAGMGSTAGKVLVGLGGLGRRAARAQAPVLLDGRQVGVVTSGQPSPTLGHPIALAYVGVEFAEPGTRLDVDVRGRPEPFEVVALPFYQRHE